MHTPLLSTRRVPLWARRLLLGGTLGLLTLLGATGAQAQTALSGAYTINSAQATGGTNFASFTAAAAALNSSGVSGPVTFTVSGGPYTEQISLGQLTGSSATNRVTFNGGGSVIQFGSSTATQRAVITLNGADYVTFNNLTVDATVGGTSTATYGWGIHLLNSSDNNVISNCTVTAANTGTTTNFAGIVSNASTSFPTTTGTTASQNLTLQNNTVTGGYYGITVVGSGSLTAPTPGVQITGNTVSNCYDAGIYISYLSGAQVVGNDVSRPSRTGAGSFYGLNMNVGTSGTTVAKNRFHQAFPAGSTTTSGAYGIYLFTISAATPTTPNYIVNNLIYDLGGSVVYGIFNGSSDNARYYYNTIDINDQTNTSASGGFGFYQTTGVNVEFRNNLVSVSRTGTGLQYALFLSSPVTGFVSNNNNLVGSGANFRTGYYQGAIYPTLTDWNTANSSTFDQNSLSVEPQFTSLTTGNLRPGNIALNNRATPLAAVTDDFTGAARSTTAPDLGAYETTPAANTASVFLRSIDAPVPPVAGGARTVTVTVGNNGTTPLTSARLTYTLNNGTAVSQTVTFAGGLAVDATQSFSFATPATLTVGRNSLTVTADQPNGSASAGSSSINRILYTAMAGTYTINKLAPASSTNFVGFADAATVLNAGGISGSVRLNVLNGPYNEQFALGVISGVSATDTIVVDGGTSRQTLSYASNASQPAAVLLNGTDYVTVHNMIVDVSAATTAGIGVHLVGQALNNRISNCIILAPTAAFGSTANAGIAVSGAVATTASGGDASGLRILNDSISGGYYGVTLTGVSAANRSTNVRISGNLIRNFYSTGLQLINHAGAQVIGNDIHRLTRGTVLSFYGIFSAGCVSTAIERNRIHDPNTGNTPSTQATYGIYFTSNVAAAGTENDVVNNLLYNFNGLGATYAIYNGGSSFARYYHNTILLDNPNPAQGIHVGFYQSSQAFGVEFRNNLVSVTRPASPSRHALYFNTTSSTILSNHNSLYVGSSQGPPAYTGTYGSVNNAPDNFVTLANWRTANSNAFDQNSVQVEPIFPASGGLQPTNAALNGAGSAATLPRVPRDFANVTRSNPPDIGAYEFNVSLDDVDVVSIDAPTATLTAGVNPVTVTVRNNGVTALTSVTLSYIRTGGTAVTQTFTGLNLANNAAQQLTFTTGLTAPFGTYTLTVTGSLPNGNPDGNASNNTKSITIQQPTPDNNEPCGAVALGGATITSSNSGATTSQQPGIVTPACSPASAPRDVWFTWTPTGTSGTLYLSGNPAGMVRVFSSPSCSAGPFTQVFCQGSNLSNTSVGTVTVTGLTANQQYYVAVSGYGSSDFGGSFTIGTTPLSTRNSSNNAALTVFPNPSATGQVTLRLAQPLGTGSIAVVNALGQVVRQQPLLTSSEQLISTLGLPTGMYIVRVQAGQQVLTRKLQLAR